MPVYLQLLAILIEWNLTAEFIELTSLSIPHIKKSNNSSSHHREFKDAIKKLPSKVRCKYIQSYLGQGKIFFLLKSCSIYNKNCRIHRSQPKRKWCYLLYTFTEKKKMYWLLQHFKALADTRERKNMTYTFFRLCTEIPKNVPTLQRSCLCLNKRYVGSKLWKAEKIIIASHANPKF